ncbi:MAG: formate dehydrogenase subunit gamma [Rhodoferax sp.]|uniref:formate dehydrogenase subunit gamma n=1 Tax=Rhodoferax sp. TaxID=50421 RepID=UPI00301770BE
MKKAFYTGLIFLLFAGGVVAQSKSAPTNETAQAVLANDTGAIKSQNILDQNPDAGVESRYAKQSNGERSKVQPGNNAPMWRQVGSGVTGYSSLPVSQAPEAGILIQPFVTYPGSRMTNAGEAWRQTRNNWLIPYGGSLIVISMLALAIMFFTKGPLGHDYPVDSKKVERFTPFERAAHWANAFAFVALAMSGLTIAFGKFILLPVIGPTLFGWLTYLLKNLHNFVGPLFAVSLLIVILTFVKDNIANAADLNWLMKAGGMLGDKQVPSHRFNAAEKGVFWWVVTIPGLVVVVSGLVLDQLVPGLGLFRSDMQIASMLHSVMAFWITMVLLGHIYMGTIGTRGALEGMKTGYVTEGWAKEHHELWLNDIKAGKIPAQRSQEVIVNPIVPV